MSRRRFLTGRFPKGDTMPAWQLLGLEAEEHLQQQVMDLATLTGWLCYHTHTSRFSPSGFPDLVLVRGERVVVAELKSEVGEVTREQQMWLETLQASGHVETYIWRPSDWARIEGALR